MEKDRGIWEEEIMGVERCDFSSDDDFRYAQQQEYDEYVEEQQMQEYIEKCTEEDYRKELISNITTERLSEICTAEKDGRCMILPCDIGDMVWFIKSMFKYLESPISATIYMFKCFKNNEITFCAHQNEIERIFKSDDIGKTVFLTKQQAEEKLAELNEVIK